MVLASDNVVSFFRFWLIRCPIHYGVGFSGHPLFLSRKLDLGSVLSPEMTLYRPSEQFRSGPSAFTHARSERQYGSDARPPNDPYYRLSVFIDQRADRTGWGKNEWNPYGELPVSYVYVRTYFYIYVFYVYVYVVYSLKHLYCAIWVTSETAIYTAIGLYGLGKQMQLTISRECSESFEAVRLYTTCGGRLFQEEKEGLMHEMALFTRTYGLAEHFWQTFL